jgi:cytochrome c peroxidase
MRLADWWVFGKHVNVAECVVRWVWAGAGSTTASVLPAVLLLATLTACASDDAQLTDPDTGTAYSGNPADFVWALPAGIAPPPVPADNPMSPAKVELGRRLFYDTRLSGNEGFACSSCHRQEFAFADARNVSVGSTGDVHPRNSIGLTNAAYHRTFGWAEPPTQTLEQHSLIPMFGVDPVELGLQGLDSVMLRRLADDPVYRQLFGAAFGSGRERFTIANITRAIAAFQRTSVSFNAPIDRFRRGDPSALSASARRGEQLFGAVGCARCHSGLHFTRATEPLPIPELFANVGLYNIGGTGAYPARNGGLFEFSRRPADMGRMKIPSLRNVALTFPYGHDGSVGSLDAVLENYARGGRLVQSGPNAGDGRENPFKDPTVRPFVMTATDKQDLLAFLRALTDSSIVTSSKLSNPWR